MANGTYEKIQKHLESPSPNSRGITRWWWYGCCVEKEEIERELDFMKDAKIGGVELQILYPLTPDDSEKGFRNIPYGSPEFYDILRFTANACKKRGMTLDITPGSSWPFGGPTVDDEDAQLEAIPYQIDVHGPKKYSCDLSTRIAGHVCAAVMGKMENCVMLPETVTDITHKLRPRRLFDWPWGIEIADVDVPSGDYKICFFVISQHQNRVGKPSRDAAGYVIDHCYRNAVDNFLNQSVEPILARVNGIRALFCDSIELPGHNWSHVLPEEFKKRRGYDLTPYIYALWGDMGEITPHIRYDYFKTMSELTIENFFDSFTEFAHANGVRSRVQAHGTWGDILRAYASADIPEGETFGDQRTLKVNTIHRRLAASAAHVYGKKVISNETYTWLKRPRFTETPQELKAAVDAVFLDGMNMIVNHGYAYSPEKAGKRGWPFYASTHINHTSSWWPVYKNLGEYVQRASELLRFGNHVSEVAIYLPQADIYADNMLSELHLAMRLGEHLDSDAMDAIQKAGYWFDYINDEALCSIGKITEDGLLINENSYKVILLIGCTRLPVETAERLAEFSSLGGIIICDGVPSKSCGMIDREKNAALVKDLMAKAKPVVVSNRFNALREELRRHLAPDVLISHPNEIGYVHRKDGDTHLYFLSNVSHLDINARLFFKDRNEAARAWSINSACPTPLHDINGEKHLHLHPYESVAVVFSTDLSDAPICTVPPVKQHKRALEGWSLSIEGNTIELPTLVTWENIKGFESYSGEGVYECNFTDSDGKMKDATLCFDELFCAARVFLNGELIGDVWTNPTEIHLKGLVKRGINVLRISVYSTLINEMLKQDTYETYPDVLPEWPYYGTVINRQRASRLNCALERREQRTPLPSGIRGEVSLRW